MELKITRRLQNLESKVEKEKRNVKLEFGENEHIWKVVKGKIIVIIINENLVKAKSLIS